MRLTNASVKVLRQFLAEPAEEQYGFGLMRATRVHAGSLYPILDRFERLGWIEGHDELIDEHVEGRPRRKLYRMTSTGVREGAEALEEFYSDLGLPHALIPPLRGA